MTSVSVLKGEITHLYQCESSLIQQWNCVSKFLFESKVDISGTTSIKNTIGIFFTKKSFTLLYKKGEIIYLGITVCLKII